MVTWKKSRRAKSTRRYRITRLDQLRALFILLVAVIIIRLFTVQILQGGYYAALASNSHQLYKELFPERGEILVQDPYSTTHTATIATNKELFEVHAEPNHVTDPTAEATALSPILHESIETLLTHLDKPTDPDEILKRRVPEEVVNVIQDLNLAGIRFRPEQWRYYPEGDITAHITGYYGYTNDSLSGQYGLEGYFNKELQGTAGYLQGEKDGFGRFLTIGDSFVQAAQDGDDLVLTVDKNIQFYACEALKKGVEAHQAKEGSVIIMQPKTGAIIAMCNYPSYDPSHYNEVDSINVFINSAVSDEYEPGSVMKSITMAAGLDRGLVAPNSTYIDTGQVIIAGRTISNYDGKTYGTQTMTEVLEKSLNLGAISVAQKLGNESLNTYVHNFGFGQLTGVELASEHSGDISQLEQLKDIYSATTSFGHGITVTPMQMITAYTAIANGGHLMQPYIVAERRPANGGDIVTQPHVVRTVISADTARTLTAMLVNVVDYHYHGQPAIPGYFLAGKTGTALIVNSSGNYDAHKHNDTFVGYGPVSEPQFVILVKMNEPQDVSYAEGSVLPIWKDIAQYLLNYYKIPPDRNTN